MNKTQTCLVLVLRFIPKEKYASVPIIIHLYRAQMRLVCGQETPNEETTKDLNDCEGARVYRDG